MMHKAWSSIKEMSYCFWGSSVKFLGHTAKKIVDFDPNLAFPDCNLSLNSPNGYKMMHKAWSSIEEVPYSFARSSVKFQARTALKIAEFDSELAFPDCNSSLNSPMATKCCTKLEVAYMRCPNVFQGHPSNFKVTWDNISISTWIEHFLTVNPVWIHQLIWNDAQSLT